MAAEHEAVHLTTKSTMELPSFMDILGESLHHEFLGITLHHWVPVIMSLIVACILVTVTYFGTRDLKKFPTGLQAFLEIIIEGMQNFFGKVIGLKGFSFLPLIGSLFLYILFMNLIGIIPLFHSPTANPNTTIALAAVVFFTTHYAGIRGNGFMGYIKHFIGEPRWLAPLFIPIHIVGEFARPLSLSMRLFGNIMGEDTAIAIFVGLGVSALYIPFQFPMLVLAILFSTIQATIFAVLASVYIGGALGHDEH